MEGTSESHLLLLFAQSRLNQKLRAGCSMSPCPDEFWVFSERNLIASLGTMCLAVKRRFLRTTLNFLCSACASQLLWTSVNPWEVSDIIFPVTTHNPLGSWCSSKVPCSHFFLGLNKLSSHRVFWKFCATCPRHVDSPPLDMLQFVIVFPTLGRLELDTVLQMWYQRCQVEGISNFPWAFSHFLRNTDIRGKFLACLHLSIHQDTQVLFCKTAFYPVTPQLYCCMELLHSRWGLLICLCWTSQRFPTANFSNCQEHFEWHPCRSVHQLLMYRCVSYFMWICKECTASHHPSQQQ